LLKLTDGKEGDFGHFGFGFEKKFWMVNAVGEF
jgi:hypothetical protein